MPLRRTFFLTCLILSVLCLATGYAVAGQWVGAGIAILMSPAWWFARKYPHSWLPFVCLLGSVGLAVTGTLLGSPPVLMFFGSTVSLAVWDTLYLDASLGNASAVEQTRQYENKHLQSLMLALGGGLLGALLGRFLELRISFIVLLLSLTFILFALDRIWGYIKKTGRA